MEIEKWNPITQILYFRLNGIRYKGKIIHYNHKNDMLSIYIFNTNHLISIPISSQTDFEKNAPRKKHYSEKNEIVSPISGRIIKIHITANIHVKANSPLITIESMKMENEIRAPFDLFIKSISISEGLLVKKEQVLLKIEISKSGCNPHGGLANESNKS